MNPIAVNIGNLSITWYAIFILSGIIIAYVLINKEAKKFNIPTSFISNLVFWCVIFGIIGARIYYVIFNLDYYAQDPIEAIKVWNGGLAIHGGIIAGLITLILYCKKEKINVLKMLDIAAPYVMLAQAIGRWGNFFNSEAHGPIVSKTFLVSHHIPKFVIDGMFIDGHYYHPTFFYESVLCLLGFVLLITIRRLKSTKNGNTIALYLIWYGVIRYFIESLRTDSLMLADFKMAQIISIIMIIVGIIMFISTCIHSNRYNEEKEQIIKQNSKNKEKKKSKKYELHPIK